MSLSYIRRTYQVPAYRGVRVEIYRPEKPVFGVITGGNHYLWVMLDGEKRSRRFHPTDDLLRYLERPTPRAAAE